MIKILHSADWHLDSPLQSNDDLRNALRAIPEKITALCKVENCDMMLLAGDLFDGVATPATVQTLKQFLADAGVPVFITPGNHDYVGANSPWLTEVWPENVHIFTKDTIASVYLPELGCRVYGAGFVSMDCGSLLEGFTANPEVLSIGIFHGDPTQVTSPYCPITTAQVQNSGLAYLALGHIHKGGSFQAGKTLCAWPGCPMGRGYDEEGEKGALIVTIDEGVYTRFVPLNTPQFYDWQIDAGDDAAAALDSLLPPVGNGHYYRVTFTGSSEPLDLQRLYRAEFPNLKLRDKTVPPVDIWSSAGEDTFEGMYFGRLQKYREAPRDRRRRCPPQRVQIVYGSSSSLRTP